MKPLSSSLFNLLQTLLLFGILVGLGSLLFYSCTAPDKQATQSPIYEDCFLKEEICQPNALWLTADSNDIITYFSIHPDSPRVLSFQINRSDVDTILQLSKAAEDSILFRVYMSLDPLATLDSTANNEPTFRPILYLVNTQKDALESSTAFPMNYVDINIIPYLKKLNNNSSDTIGKAVPSVEALEFITHWDTLSQEAVYNTFYENAIPSDTGRVKFYTFLGDTKPIIKALSEDTTDIMYLHLGVFNEPDSIPLRTIIHIDNPKRFVSPITIDPNNPPLFEFAVPCPKLCGKD
ncbi:hypothetical protein [Lewinella cohaerens]|uniref:hypothetical protein n=1 Tax=Lewinella cohaerens TaxID=70995 RepID=UPI000381B543|nr:hypothetical protein [Lewinella cohaerens]